MRRVVWGHAADWSGFQTVLACGPALVLNGQMDVQPELEGFHDPHVMGATAAHGRRLHSRRPSAAGQNGKRRDLCPGGRWL